MSNSATCTHIKVTGIRCGSPALSGEQFCYFHQNAHRGVRRPKQPRLHPIALIEDEESIQYALMEVINALMRNTIDLKRATLILRALHIAVKNATRVKYSIGARDMVTKIPAYAEPTEQHEALALESDLPAVAANPNLPIGPQGPHYWEQKAEAARRAAREDSIRFDAEARSREEARKRFAEERAAEAKARAESVEMETANSENSLEVTAAVGYPAKPQASVSAAEPLAHPVQPTSVPPHNLKKTAPEQPTAASTRNTTITNSPRKPPSSTQPAKQKSAAHAASRA